MALPRPIIFVPGVTATELRDLYAFPPDTVWALLHSDYERAGQHPEDARYEGRLPAQIVPDRVYDLAYREMVLDLRHDLSPTADRPVPVYAFGYDWRQPLEAAQAKLAVFVQEVIEKTSLTRHYRADGYANDPKVNLLGHSMGGMVITGYLADAGRAARVDRVATIATPFRGSLAAVEKILLGTNNRREREAARLTPSLYYLLPSFTQGITLEPPLPQTDLFDPRLWQVSVVESIQEALRLRGSGAVKDTPANAKKILDKFLSQAKAHRQKIETFDPASCGLEAADWLCVIGIGDKTRVELKVTQQPIGPYFDLLSPAMIDDQISDPPTWRTGDGTVPYEGAQPGFSVTRQVYSHRDWRLLELREKGLDMLTALHGILPNMDRLQERLRNHFA